MGPSADFWGFHCPMPSLRDTGRLKKKSKFTADVLALQIPHVIAVGMLLFTFQSPRVAPPGIQSMLESRIQWRRPGNATSPGPASSLLGDLLPVWDLGRNLQPRNSGTARSHRQARSHLHWALSGEGREVCAASLLPLTLTLAAPVVLATHPEEMIWEPDLSSPCPRPSGGFPIGNRKGGLLATSDGALRDLSRPPL